MSENKETKDADATSDKPEPNFNFMDSSDVRIPLTYTLFQPFVQVAFFCKIILSETEKEIRQKHFALSLDEQANAEHAYNVEMLSKMATRAPEGFPGFEQHLKDCFNDLEVAVTTYFSEPRPMSITICRDALNSYTTLTQPAEFFR